jgi:altronate dehydratase
MSLTKLLCLHPRDNVGVAIQTLHAGDSVAVPQGTLTVRQTVPAGHKLAWREIPADSAVLKYGEPIGRATQPILPGEHVHSHNLADEHTVITTVQRTDPPPSPSPRPDTFDGYVRPHGGVGTRNYVAIVSTVNCSASVSRMVAAKFDAERMQRWPHVDGVIALVHEAGCGMAFDSLKHQMLSRTLAGMTRHPNLAGTVLIGLGCEQNTVGYMSERHQVVPLFAADGRQLTEHAGTPVLTMQDEGGTRRTIEKAETLVEEMLDRANTCRRQPVDASHLTVGLECGGSDGYSGITANPAVGVAADRIVAAGGAAILSETSEIYGAEHLLVRRSRSPEVAAKLIERIEWWKGYVAMFGQTLDNNPSVGNKAGGLTTITEKSLGAVSKSGSTALEAVYEYAEPVTARGFSVMDTPGFDPASVTGKVAGGANVILFTTGRGSCFGCKPTPSIKIATNTSLFERLDEDMDLNAGTILSGEEVQDVGEAIYQAVRRVASGEKTKSEGLGIGDNEFVPWAVGPTL